MIGLMVFLVAIVSGVGWIGLVAPAILRSFGVPIAFGLWRLDRRNQSLSKTQYVWAFGVFSWGLGMFFFSTVADYLGRELLGATSPIHIIAGLVICLGAGCLFGVLTAPRPKSADIPGR
jgi:hypothetical protein